MRLLRNIAERNDDQFTDGQLRAGRRSERGSAIFLIILAVIMLGSITYAVFKDQSATTVASNKFRIYTEIRSQVDYIYAAIIDCELSEGSLPYIAGTAVYGTTDGSGDVDDLVCDRQSGATVSLWGGFGRGIPRPISGWGTFQFVVSGTTLSLRTTATGAGDPTITAALNELDGSYGATEANVDTTNGIFTYNIRL